MNLQQQKKQFVIDFLSVNNEQVINKLEHLLKEEKSKLSEIEFEPFTMDEFNELIDKAEKESVMNKVKSADDLKKKLTHGDKVLWTNSAIEKLEGIFEYYNAQGNLTFARNIVNKIVDKTILLETHPKSGQIEELLIRRSKEYGSLIEGNYKIKEIASGLI